MERNKDRFERGCEAALTILREQGGLKAMLIGFCERGIVAVLCDAPDDPHFKDMLAMLAAAAFRRYLCDEYHFVSEVWYALGPGCEPPPGKGVRDMPGRREGLVVSSYRADGPGRTRIYRIVRDTAGAIEDLLPEPIPAQVTMEGRFHGLLPPPGAPPLTQARTAAFDLVMAALPADYPIKIRLLFGTKIAVDLRAKGN